ncbi:MAG: class I SAM-dependent methyltransferase [Marinomonas sp.]
MIKMLDYQALWDQQQWPSFTGLVGFPLHKHPNKEHLAMLLCGAALQLDDVKVAKQLIAQSMTLVDDQEVLRGFILAVHQIQLGKAELLAGNPEKALSLFQEAYQQYGRLTQPLFYDFLCEAAEAHLAAGETRAAIQAWQDIASILQTDTPEHVYHRMSYCYSVNKQGFGGSKEENHLHGDFHKHDLFEFFHENLQPNFYFEIGVDEGLSLARAKKKALGVDARPDLDLKVILPDTAQIMGVSSDGFFRDHAKDIFTSKPDLAFIDGMHLFEFALRDFINLEKYAAPYTLVGIDDIFPCHPIQAERRRQSSAWTGDVWKIILVLEKYRPDLTLVKLRCFTTGLLLITGLDSKNTVLQDHYDEIMADYQDGLELPDTILHRENSLSSDHPLVGVLVDVLKQARAKQASLKHTRSALKPIRTLLNQAIEQVDPQQLKSLNDIVSNTKHKTLVCQQNPLSQIQAQLFVPNPETDEYDESHSIKVVADSGGWQELSFELPATVVWKPLRFDPDMAAGIFEISEVCLQEQQGKKVYLHLTGSQLADKLTLQGDAFILRNSGDSFVFYSYSTDPNIIFPNVEIGQGDSVLTVRMRKVKEGAELRNYWRQHFS